MFNLFKKKKEEPRVLTDLDFEVAGSCFYETNIKKLKVKNQDYSLSDSKLLEDYKKPIYQYYYINKPVKLIPEPTNKHDSNAIQVVIAGEVVGHVPSELCEQVHLALNERDIKFISSFIKGGSKSKYRAEDGNLYIREARDFEINIRMRYI